MPRRVHDDQLVVARGNPVALGEGVPADVVPRIALGVIPILLMLQWSKVLFDVQTFTGLAAAGSAMVVLFVVTWVLFVYRDDPYVDLKAHLGGRRVWRWSRA